MSRVFWEHGWIDGFFVVEMDILEGKWYSSSHHGSVEHGYISYLLVCAIRASCH